MSRQATTEFVLATVVGGVILSTPFVGFAPVLVLSGLLLIGPTLDVVSPRKRRKKKR